MAHNIPLSGGRVAIVDDADASWLSQWRWYCTTDGYAVRKVNGDKFQMHRAILGPAPGELIDHVNGDRLDNRRSNLRKCSPSQNCSNRGPARNNTSGFKGVIFLRKNGRWRAVTRSAGVTTYIGEYRSAVEAARAYDAAARNLHGEFAWLNFPSATLGGPNLEARRIGSSSLMTGLSSRHAERGVRKHCERRGVA